MKLLDKLFKRDKHRCATHFAKSFRDAQQAEAAYTDQDLGIQSVPLTKVVGSMGRYRDFDAQFHLKKNMPSDRLEKIIELMRAGKPLPPVKLFQIKDEYYAVDGNHRVAAAKKLGHDSIDAHIVEFLPSQNSLENILYCQKRDFYQKTGLKAEIDLTEIGQYGYLERQISQHQQYLEKQADADVSYQQAARDWHRTIYKPLTRIIKKGKLLDQFPQRALADMYAYVTFHQWVRGRKRRYGIGIDESIPNSMALFREKMARTDQMNPPDLQRSVTAFVLVNIQVGQEKRIMDKLFSLGRVEEIHSVPGDIDLIAKIRLNRDLLTSDSEVIGQYIQRHFSSVSGVVKTQTLIPFSSRVKNRRNATSRK